MRKILGLTVVCLLLVMQLWAQTKQVSGKIIDGKNGNPLVGVTISANGRSIGVSSENGDFTVSVPGNVRKLSFTSVGYSDVEAQIGAGALSVTMNVGESNSLSEIVVTGYKTAQRKSFTGSAGTVKGADIAAVPIASFDQALQGRTPGLILKANSGQPGASGSAIIRGRGSINGSTEPIYVVDGIQINAADFAQLNPNDIENVSVLKDAVATSLYGSRGGNGVIVVSTKRGTNGKTRLELDVYTGWSQLPDFNGMRLMTTNEKIDYELRRGGPQTLLPTYTPAMIDSLRKINTDWFKEITRTGRTTSVNASAAGGSDKTKYFASVNYFTQEGTVRNTGFDRIVGRFNLSQEAGNFSFGINATGTASDFQNTAESNTSVFAPLNAGVWTNPYEQPFQPGRYDRFGNFIAGGTTLARPEFTKTEQPIPTTQLFINSNNSVDLRTVLSANAEYQF